MRLRALLLLLLALLLLPATAQARDRDRDRLPDRWEKRFHLSTKSKGTRKDPDGDGLSNLGEYRSRTSPRRPDSDGDRIPDDDEDPDRDGVDNGNELREGTRPRDRDSDNDRRSDGREDRDRDGLRNAAEDLTGNDPKDRDSDNDGTGDRDERGGVVLSLVDSTLVIDRGGGTGASGLVVMETEMECKSEDELEDLQPRVARAAADQDGDTSDDDVSDGPPLPEDGSGDADGPAAQEESCTAAALVPGARVHEAEGVMSSAGLLFTKIELIR